MFAFRVGFVGAVVTVFLGGVGVSAFVLHPVHSTAGTPFLVGETILKSLPSKTAYHSAIDDGSSMEEDYSTNRRATLASFISCSLMWIGFDSAEATTGSIKTSQYAGASSASKSKVKPEVAFDALLKAREELQVGLKTYLVKRDYDGLRTFLTEDATNMNDFEGNALAILASKRLDDEDKKAIGTIRRYGAGADVLIMYGGLMAEIDEGNDEPDHATVQKYLTRTIDSLDEVISICRSGGFGG